ncbi:hypothetical protein M1E07_09325 [Arthrobacter sp. Z4-13]
MGRTDRVTAVIIPMDGATRIPVRSGIDVQLWDRDRQEIRPVRLIKNLNGQFALLNEETNQEVTFRIVTERSDYRGPVFQTFNPEVDGSVQVVALERRPNASFDDVATLVRGRVVGSTNAGGPGTHAVEGVKVAAFVSDAAGAAGHQFAVTTDDRGAFALIVNIKRPAPDETQTVPAQLRFEKDGQPTRILDINLKHGLTHAFSRAIDLDDNDPIKFSHE